MRHLLPVLVAVVACSPCCAAEPAAPFAFDLKAEPVVLLEGGPVLVKLTLTYKGPKRVTVCYPCSGYGDGIDIQAPKTWQERKEEDSTHLASGSCGPCEVAAGDEFVCVAPLHRRYKVPAGRAHLRFTWGIDNSYNDEHIPSPVADLDLDVPPATPENVARLRRQMEAALDALPDRPTGTARVAKERIAHEICGSAHDAFIPLAFRLMQDRERHWIDPGLRDHVYRWSRLSKQNHIRLLQYLHDHGGENDFLIFCCWAAHKVVLPDQDIAYLLDSGDLWIRVRTLEYYPRQAATARADIQRDVEALHRLLNRGTTDSRPGAAGPGKGSP